MMKVWSHEIYEVPLERGVQRILDTGERAIVDGVGENARLSGALPRRSIIRVITLGDRGA